MIGLLPVQRTRTQYTAGVGLDLAGTEFLSAARFPFNVGDAVVTSPKIEGAVTTPKMRTRV